MGGWSTCGKMVGLSDYLSLPINGQPNKHKEPNCFLNFIPTSKQAATVKTCANRLDFERALEKQGIGILFRQNEGGRIYGATFIDHEQKCVFNGSRLGKEFSANVFNDLFNHKEQAQAPEQAGHKTGQIPEPGQQAGRAFEENSDFGGIFDFLLPHGSAGDDYAEQAFLRRLKKKRKRNNQIKS